MYLKKAIFLYDVEMLHITMQDPVRIRKSAPRAGKMMIVITAVAAYS